MYIIFVSKLYDAISKPKRGCSFIFNHKGEKNKDNETF